MAIEILIVDDNADIRNILKELKSTEQDQFNIVLKIITDKPL